MGYRCSYNLTNAVAIAAPLTPFGNPKCPKLIIISYNIKSIGNKADTIGSRVLPAPRKSIHNHGWYHSNNSYGNNPPYITPRIQPQDLLLQLTIMVPIYILAIAIKH